LAPKSNTHCFLDKLILLCSCNIILENLANSKVLLLTHIHEFQNYYELYLIYNFSILSCITILLILWGLGFESIVGVANVFMEA